MKSAMLIYLCMLFFYCSSKNETTDNNLSEEKFAKVLSVEVSGKANAYSFTVELSSPDKGCSQYADWWEVVTTDGLLLSRRILTHSHVDEQPFTRSSGPVKISQNETVIIRGHMHPVGYGKGSIAMKGTAKNGFTVYEHPDNFATGLADQPPLPDGCRF